MNQKKRAARRLRQAALCHAKSLSSKPLQVETQAYQIIATLVDHAALLPGEALVVRGLVMPDSQDLYRL